MRRAIQLPTAQRLLVAVVVLVVVVWSADLSAETIAVPIGLQVELVTKLAAHDRNMSDRARDRLKVAIVAKKDDAESGNAAARLRTEFGRVGEIAGLPHEEQVVVFGDAAALAALVRTQQISILYFTPGFWGDIDAVRQALDGVSVLSVSSVPDYVPKGMVLGFDLVSGKAKILVNLPQARKQSVTLDASVLKISTVVR